MEHYQELTREQERQRGVANKGRGRGWRRGKGGVVNGGTFYRLAFSKRGGVASREEGGVDRKRGRSPRK